MTDHNEQYEVDPVPEWVGILHVVHDIRPSLQRDHKEDGHPCEADVVERYRTLEEIICFSSIYLPRTLIASDLHLETILNSF